MKSSDFFLEFWGILALIFPLGAAIVVLGLQVSGWRGSEQFAEGLGRGNWAVVVLVQLVSQTLGLILVCALCAVVKIHLRISVAKGPVTLEKARFLTALSQARPLLSDRAIFTIGALLAALLSTIPGALWAGAISPHVATNTVDRRVQIPFYSESFIEIYADGGEDTSELYQNDKGIFTGDANLVADSLLSAATRASNKQRLHPKLDNTGYTFVGRSYGTGSLVGFEPINDTVKPLAYTYYEVGIVADVDCFRNTSSMFGIVANYTSYDGAGFAGTMGQTAGYFPDGNPVAGSWIFGSLPGDLFAIGGVNNYGQRHADLVVASAGTTGYRDFTWTYHKIQCKLNFTPHNIRLDVNTTAKTITTTKLAEEPWPDFGDVVVHTALWAPPALTITDNAFGGSRVERAMQENAELLYFDTHGDFPTVQVPDALLFQSISDFMTDVVDNMMVVSGGYQSQYFHSVTSTGATVTVPSVVFGHDVFEYIVLTLTLLVVIICIGYITVRSAWNNIVRIDLTDVSNVVLNASKGGRALFHGYEERNRFEDISITLSDASSRWPGIVYASGSDGLNQEMLGNTFLRKPTFDVSSASDSLLTTVR